MSAFNIWKENPPPRETIVLAKFDLLDARWQLFRTCRRGCCVFSHPADGLGSWVLPKYWREPTAEELSLPDISSRQE